MDYRREDLTYRRINRLAAAQLAGACILVLTIAIVAILQNAQLRRESNRIEDRLSAANDRLGTLEAQVASLQQTAAARRSEAPPAVDDGEIREPAARRRSVRDVPPVGEAPLADPTPPPADDPAALLAAAEAAFAGGDDDAALRGAEAVVKAGHAPGAAEYILAAVYARRGFFAEALPHAIRSAEATDSPARTPERLWLLTRIALETGDLSLADATLERILGWSTIGENPALLSAAAATAGGLAVDRGDARRARRLLDLAIATDAANPRLDRLSARVFYAEGKWADAAATAAEALKSHPDEVVLLAVLGPALVRSDRPGEALAPLRAWIAAAPTQAAAYDWMGRASLALLKPEDAVAAFDQAIRLAPSPELYYRRAVGLMNHGDLDGAIASLTASIDGDPDQPLPHFAKAICLAKKGDPESAERSLERALALDGSLMEQAARVEAFASFLAGNASPKPAKTGDTPIPTNGERAE
jgi:tetratricopeptide (TPR) repeat protein